MLFFAGQKVPILTNNVFHSTFSTCLFFVLDETLSRAGCSARLDMRGQSSAEETCSVNPIHGACHFFATQRQYSNAVDGSAPTGCVDMVATCKYLSLLECVNLRIAHDSQHL